MSTATVSALAILLAFGLDLWRGEPPARFHPVVWMGQYLERAGRLIAPVFITVRNPGDVHAYSARRQFLAGEVAWLLGAMVCTLAASLLQWGIFQLPGWMAAPLLALCLKPLFAWAMLRDLVARTETALQQGLDAGRSQLAHLVSRNVHELDTAGVRESAIETLAENLSDGVVGPILSWALLGTPGILTYKMINTQDSMVGYLNERYRAYGFFSAKLDDLVNLLPSRLTALFLLLGAGRLDLIPFVLREGKKHLSPNSGYPEAALAGLLGCRFGGAHDYFGEVVEKPYIGDQERELTYADLTLAVRYFKRASWLALLFACLLRGLLLLLYLSSTYSLILPV